MGNDLSFCQHVICLPYHLSIWLVSLKQCIAHLVPSPKPTAGVFLFTSDPHTIYISRGFSLLIILIFFLNAWKETLSTYLALLPITCECLTDGFCPPNTPEREKYWSHFTAGEPRCKMIKGLSALGAGGVIPSLRRHTTPSSDWANMLKRERSCSSVSGMLPQRCTQPSC